MCTSFQAFSPTKPISLHFLAERDRRPKRPETVNYWEGQHFRMHLRIDAQLCIQPALHLWTESHLQSSACKVIVKFEQEWKEPASFEALVNSIHFIHLFLSESEDRKSVDLDFIIHFLCPKIFVKSQHVKTSNSQWEFENER